MYHVRSLSQCYSIVQVSWGCGLWHVAYSFQQPGTNKVAQSNLGEFIYSFSGSFIYICFVFNGVICLSIYLFSKKEKKVKAINSVWYCWLSAAENENFKVSVIGHLTWCLQLGLGHRPATVCLPSSLPRPAAGIVRRACCRTNQTPPDVWPARRPNGEKVSP